MTRVRPLRAASARRDAARGERRHGEDVRDRRPGRAARRRRRAARRSCCVVTFTRMATGELRERVRDRLVDRRARARARARRCRAAGGRPRARAACATAPTPRWQLRRRRLAEAVSDFDAATIATTHGFCRHVLAGLGVAGDVERDVTFVEDLSDLVEEVVDDLYVRRFHRVAAAAVRPRRGPADRPGRGRQPARPPRAGRATPGRRGADVGDAPPPRARPCATEVEARKRRAGS